MAIVKRSPLQVPLSPGEREKLEEIADRLQVSLAEAARKAIEAYQEGVRGR
jgi:hypothetical protein